MMGKLKIVMDPEQREKYLAYMLELDGLSGIVEDPLAAYCPISLTSTPTEIKHVLEERQEQTKAILARVEITGYFPNDSSKYNPDMNTDAQPAEVYNYDTIRVLNGRFFTGHTLIPSTGQGNEAEKARIFNRIAVTFMDQAVRTSRMQPFRTIYLQYEDFNAQQDEFVPVFEMLKQFDPGMGFVDELPVLVGFPRDGGSPVDLEKEVYDNFPRLQYRYEGKVPIVELRVVRPRIFYDFDKAKANADLEKEKKSYRIE